MSSTIKLTLRDIININIGISALQGYTKVVGDKAVQLPFVFDDNTKWNLSKNKRITRSYSEDYEEHRQDEVKRLSPVHGDLSKESQDINHEFSKWYNAKMKAVHEVDGILTISRAGLLKNGENPVDTNVLELLLPIITE